jgi:farnesyl-diphosphate farnesyltransferase
MFKVKYGGIVRQTHPEPLEDLADKLNDVDFCYAVLNKVSRSFAVVIQQLPEDLKDPVCIFYLVLRGLDSVEDDMDYPNKDKLPLLETFHEKLYEDGWRISGVGDAHNYRVLMAHFDKVIRVFKSMDKKYQDVVADITKRMGNGMAKYVRLAEKQGHGGVDTLAEWDEYCHYVAGLVGYGLSDLFSASGLESKSLSEEHRISNSMGLFLQKTNIIRDYLEDLEVGRVFWPKDVWSKYTPDGKLSYFRDHPTAEHTSLACLNHLVTNAMSHVPDCIEYMKRIKHPMVFRFCAIPQVMAIATLAAVYNNPDVFRRNVKIRKGLSCKLMLQTNSLEFVKDCFRQFASDMGRRIPRNDPHAKEMKRLVAQTKDLTQVSLPTNLLRMTSAVAWVVLLVACLYLLGRYRERRIDGSSITPSSGYDFGALVSSFMAIGYLFGFFGMQYV